MAAEQGSLPDPQSLAVVFFTVSDFASNFEIVTCITCASVSDGWLVGWLVMSHKVTRGPVKVKYYVLTTICMSVYCTKISDLRRYSSSV